MTEPRIVVVIDDEVNMGRVLTKFLRLQGLEVQAFTDPKPALEWIDAHVPSAVLTDLRMPGLTGEQVLEFVRRRHPSCPVILMTGYGTVESALRCVRQGAFDYITKPFETPALLATLKKALDQEPTAPPPPASPPSIAESAGIVGLSAPIQQIRTLIGKFAPTESPVIVYGESGTGKELAARAIHSGSARRSGRFVAINCASIPESLIESELFGHERGAFTGAGEARIGLIEAAGGGTLFLDEIGELPLALQAKLLRALQEKEITRVGSISPIRVDFRLVAATNRRLEESVRVGQFREDLFYRLNVLVVQMPPLRDRGDDIALLANHFLAEFRIALKKEDLRFSPELLQRMRQMPWPGNVRELRNFVERAAVMQEGPELLDEAPTAPVKSAPGGPPIPASTSGPLPEFREARDHFEAEYLRTVLRACGGNVSEAAKKAGMSRRNFYEKIEKLGLDPSEFK